MDGQQARSERVTVVLQQVRRVRDLMTARREAGGFVSVVLGRGGKGEGGTFETCFGGADVVGFAGEEEEGGDGRCGLGVEADGAD